MTVKEAELNNRPISQNDDGSWTVSLAKKLYQKAAVFAAAYKFNARCVVHIEPKGEDRVLVTFKNEKEAGDGERSANEFCSEVLDQQYRQDLQGQFGHLRDLIVEQAFKPVANLKEKLK